jgi:hypothetical protein
VYGAVPLEGSPKALGTCGVCRNLIRITEPNGGKKGGGNSE